jgi:hypothetical protein
MVESIKANLEKEEKVDDAINKMRDSLKAYDKVCMNGKSPNSLIDKLNTFRQGPCSPIILAPGIMSTALRVMIDCEGLRAESPELFSTCGWNACSGLFRSIPAKEYNIWLDANPLNPMGIIKPQVQAHRCFTGMFVSELKSVKIDFKGRTPESEKDSRCGVLAVTDIVNGIINPRGSEVYRDLVKNLENMGHISGLTMQALPYDFRQSFQNTKFELLSIAKQLRSLTGKKSMIVAHSMGNLNTAYRLS